jgi:hypothetical protein
MREIKTPIRCEEDDPNRCQASTPRGQCKFLAQENQAYCTYHLDPNKTENANLYEFNRTEFHSKFSARINQFRKHERTRDISEEIGVLRVILERTLTRCTDDYELILQAPNIQELIDKIEKLIQSSIKIDKYIGELLSKQQVLQIAQELVNVVAEEVQSEDTIRKIAKRFEEIVNRNQGERQTTQAGGRANA